MTGVLTVVAILAVLVDAALVGALIDRRIRVRQDAQPDDLMDLHNSLWRDS